MTEAVEVAIELALFRRVTAFANANGFEVAFPNKDFKPSDPSQNARYLRATLLPFPTVSRAIPFSAKNQHTGLLQIDVIAGKGCGSSPLTRIAAQIIAYFDVGLSVTVDGFVTQVLAAPYRTTQIMIDGAWAMLPVRIPYNCFAGPPA